MNRLESPVGEIRWEETPQGISAEGKLPQTAEFFKDHFPAFPVLPGVLTLEIFKKIAEDFSIRKMENPEMPRRLARLTHLSGVRFSAYLRPGEDWTARLEHENKEGRIHWKASLSSRGQLAAQARFILEPVSIMTVTDNENGRVYGS